MFVQLQLQRIINWKRYQQAEVQFRTRLLLDTARHRITSQLVVCLSEDGLCHHLYHHHPSHHQVTFSKWQIAEDFNPGSSCLKDLMTDGRIFDDAASQKYNKNRICGHSKLNSQNETIPSYPLEAIWKDEWFRSQIDEITQRYNNTDMTWFCPLRVNRISWVNRFIVRVKKGILIGVVGRGWEGGEGNVMECNQPINH